MTHSQILNLVSQYDSPFYLVDRSRFERRRKLLSALGRGFKKSRPGPETEGHEEGPEGVVQGHGGAGRNGGSVRWSQEGREGAYRQGGAP